MTPCIIGKGSFSDGYMLIKRGGRLLRAHRIAYEEVFGPIPDGLCVLHACDKRHCINPDHLFLGTREDNIHDAVKKGRHAHGSTNGHAKLTEIKVMEIKLSNAKAAVLAKRFNISIMTIYDIRAGRTWRHVACK
jgi:hypothetical protein